MPQNRKISLSQFCFLWRLVYNQSSPVHPVSESRHVLPSLQPLQWDSHGKTTQLCDTSILTGSGVTGLAPQYIDQTICTVRNMKLQIKLTYSTAGKAYGHRNIGENTSRFVLTMSHVIKVLGQFHVWIIPYLQKLNKYKRQFSDHILYQYHKKFYVFHRPSNQLNDMLKPPDPWCITS